ncbi:pyruvate dehydrogenase E2 component (dihydrolipoamide acetyltransferase) [Salsuginibacillus halophilus]|uniref:Dihydrolipoamide acetyltransferase component of pyruvate dehydrogenase complex n=1 Tax=Salsuginibacillus halophilus TaxID=517424 RepID=A0A2P8HQG6_9BACI|nr:biotin/lipoyl-containing protein [Salsuginibacillus halophilus]PSL48463.1 pyruvate dehydrogenase E2 component (dihydrolipoamide acetyltransferase) [Salsuginibacillus halophilus]
MIEVKLSDIGEGMHEAEVLDFLVEPGDVVKNDEPLVEIQTDKMAAEISAPGSGKVAEFKAKVGDVIEVGDTIIVIDDGSAEKAQPESSSSEKSGDNQTEKQEASLQTSTMAFSKGRRVLAAPYTRKIARENDVDIEQIQGSGPAGRVTEEDVYQAMHQESETAAAVETEVKQESVVKESLQSVDAAPWLSTYFTSKADIQLDRLETLGVISAEDPEATLTNVAVLLKAFTLSARRQPFQKAGASNEAVNAAVLKESERPENVAVLKHVDQLSVRETAEQLKRLAPEQEEMKERPVFTMQIPDALHNNLPDRTGYAAGMMVNIHKITKKPVVVEDEVKVRSVLEVTFTYDSREVDAAMAPVFIQDAVQLLEHPQHLLMELV